MARLNGTASLDRYEVADGAKIVSGELVALNAAGKAVPASDAAGLTVIGVAEQAVEELGVTVYDDVTSFANDSASPITRADRGKAACVKDSLTVGATGTNKVAAGIVVDVYDGEVYVDLSPAALATARLLLV